MQWSRSRNTLKVIFLVGDAPPKMNYTDDVKYMVATRTPYDLKLTKLSRELDHTYVFHGSASFRGSARARLERATRSVRGEVAASRAAVRGKLGLAGLDRRRKDLVALHARAPTGNRRRSRMRGSAPADRARR